MTSASGKRRILAIGLVLLVVATFVIVSMVKRSEARTNVSRWIDTEAQLVGEDITEAIDAVLADLESVSAFVESGHPTPSSFSAFVREIEGNAYALGIGYTPVVPAQDLDDFISEHQAVDGADYEIFGLDAAGVPTPIDRTGRTVYFPVEFLDVGDLITPLVTDAPIRGRGLDTGFNESWRAEATRAVAIAGPALSPFISVDIKTISFDRVFFASVPVKAADGSVLGLVQALMLERLLLPDVQGHALNSVDWEITQDGAQPSQLDPALAQIYPLELPGAKWSLAIAPTPEVAATLSGWPWWVVGLYAAFGTFLVGAALLLLIDRRTEHHRIVRFQQQAEEQDRFLASVSHELRTPLTVVSGLVNELNDQPDSFTDKDRDSLMNILVEQTDELSGIVEDLLVAARSDISMVAIHHTDVDLGVEAERAMATANISVVTRGIPGSAFADAHRVRQILRNLLTNAKRYGGPTIRIEFAEGVGWTEVVVADDGDGVPRDKREAIFQSYESAHAPGSAVGSIGLGLYISRTLAQAMGGNLEYVYDGSWSRFRLRLPSAQARSNPTDVAIEDKAQPNPISIS